MTGRNKSQDPAHQPRRDRMYEEHVQDPYQLREKLPEPTVCPDCGAVYHKGRWQWGDAPKEANSHRCPACSRIQDAFPAGALTVSGGFFVEHREEIMHLIRNMEEKEKAEHPLERIMKFDDEGDRLVVAYTGVHLTKGTGEALHHAYQGDLDINFTDKDGELRVSWQR